MTTTYGHQLIDAYIRMANDAHYRPAAPSDGFGNITTRSDQLNIRREIAEYAQIWRKDEDSHRPYIGVPAFEDRQALIFTVEAARNLCGVQRDVAVRLLRMAADDIERRQP